MAPAATITLDPTFWQARGKGLGWDQPNRWKMEWHRFSDTSRIARMLRASLLRTYKKKSPHCCGLFCITNRGIRRRRS
jgi:hypothetical protein